MQFQDDFNLYDITVMQFCPVIAHIEKDTMLIANVWRVNLGVPQLCKT
jgi:tyrosine-protein phosphatase YwqE